MSHEDFLFTEKFKKGDRVLVKKGNSYSSLKFNERIGIITEIDDDHYYLDIEGSEPNGLWENELTLIRNFTTKINVKTKIGFKQK